MPSFLIKYSLKSRNLRQFDSLYVSEIQITVNHWLEHFLFSQPVRCIPVCSSVGYESTCQSFTCAHTGMA